MNKVPYLREADAACSANQLVSYHPLIFRGTEVLKVTLIGVPKTKVLLCHLEIKAEGQGDTSC